MVTKMHWWSSVAWDGATKMFVYGVERAYVYYLIEFCCRGTVNGA